MTRIAAFGGVYSNPYALAALADDSRARGCERAVLPRRPRRLRRRVRRGLPLLLEHGVTTIAGNYDVAIGARRRGLRLRLRRRARQPLRAAHVRLHAGAHVAASSRRGWRELPGELRERDRRRRRPHGPRLAAGDQRLPVGVARRRRARAAACARAARGCCSARTRASRGSARCDGTRIVNVGAIGRPANDGRTEVWYAVIDLDGRRDRARRARRRWPTTGARRRRRCARPGCPSRSSRRSRRAGGRRAWRSSRRASAPAARYHVYREAMPAGLRRRRRRLGRRARARRRRPPGRLAVRHGAVPAAAVGLLELPLQPRLRLLRRRELAAGAQARAAGGALRGARRRGACARASPSSTSPAASRSSTRTSSR